MKVCPHCSFQNEDTRPTCVWCDALIFDVESIPSTDPDSTEHERVVLIKRRHALLHRKLLYAAVIYCLIIPFTAALLGFIFVPYILLLYLAAAILVVVAVNFQLVGQISTSFLQGALSLMPIDKNPGATCHRGLAELFSWIDPARKPVLLAAVDPCLMATKTPTIRFMHTFRLITGLSIFLVVLSCYVHGQTQPSPKIKVDKFGIQKIYDDAPQPANNWAFAGNPNDPRLMEDRFVEAGNGWFKPENTTKLRFEVLSDPAANEKTIETFDLAKVLARGYLYKPPDSADGPGDFLNIEQTWRFKVIKTGTGTVNGEAHIELVPGGYRQTSDKIPVGKDKAVPASCESMSYHFNIYPLTGRVKFEKDSDHTTGYAKSNPEKNRAVPRFDDGREIVQKAVLYRTAAGMKLETYLDMTGKGDHFEKVLEFEDAGQWGPTEGGNSECHCPENVILTMARVAVGYRCDNMADFQFKDMSIRSIDPAKPLRPESARQK
jgi:hypothetical protein